MLIKKSDKEKAITYNFLKDTFYYDIETGIFTWKVKKGRKVRIGGVAGGNMNGYIDIRINNKNYRAHRLAWLYVHGKFPDGVIDHINGIRDDNRIINLRDVPFSINQQNKTKQKRENKDIPTGISAIKYKGVINAYRAEWSDIDKKRCYSKYFNINKYGHANAISNAVKCRELAIDNLIKKGAGYTNRHGR